MAGGAPGSGLYAMATGVSFLGATFSRGLATEKAAGSHLLRVGVGVGIKVGVGVGIKVGVGVGVGVGVRVRVRVRVRG